jgi:hypothetical protein
MTSNGDFADLARTLSDRNEAWARVQGTVMGSMECSSGPRDPRAGAPVIGMDLTRSGAEIHSDLRARFPRVIGLWWELEEDERSGWVYDGSSHVRARLVQS